MKNNVIQPRLSGKIEDGCHHLLARVYYADTDLSGLVYHSRYLCFMERGRTDYLRWHGIESSKILKSDPDQSLVWVVKHMDIDFLRPARVDDLLCIETRLCGQKGARGFMQQYIRYADQKEILVKADVEVVLINQQLKPVRWPKSWLNFLTFSDRLA